jgi:hypothetical protein
MLLENVAPDRILPHDMDYTITALMISTTLPMTRNKRIFGANNMTDNAVRL